MLLGSLVVGEVALGEFASGEVAGNSVSYADLNMASLAVLDVLDTLDVEDFLLCAGTVFLGSVAPSSVSLATGHERPLSLPRLATPTPQVKVVLYPEQSFPNSKHWLQ